MSSKKTIIDEGGSDHEFLDQKGVIANPTKIIKWPIIEKVLRLLFGTALTLLVARQIGPAQFGAFSAAFAIYMIFDALAGLGLRTIIIDEVSSGRADPRLVLSTAAAMIAIASVLASIMFITVIASLYGSYGTEFWVSLVLSSIFILKALEVLLFGLESYAELRSISLSQLTAIFVGAVGKIAILLIGATVMSLTVVTAVELIVLYFAAAAFAFRHDLAISMTDFRIKYAFVLIKRSWPLAFASLAVIGYFYVDQIIIGLLMDAESVGIYAAASRISQQLYILPIVLVAAYYPRMTKIFALSQKTFEDFFINACVVLIVLSFLISITLLLISGPILWFILGDEFVETSRIFALHAMGLAFASLNVMSGRWLVMQGFQWLELLRQILTVSLNVILNFLLIPLFGLHGAVYATLISILFLALGFDLLFARTHPLARMKFAAILRFASPRRWGHSFKGLASL